jgi:hypothetical protein
LIISNNEDIDMVLRSMGFDQSFDFCPPGCEPPPADAEPVNAEAASAQELRRTMLEAHRALMRLSEAGRLEFEQVVECLERDTTPNLA